MNPIQFGNVLVKAKSLTLSKEGTDITADAGMIDTRVDYGANTAQLVEEAIDSQEQATVIELAPAILAPLNGGKSMAAGIGQTFLDNLKGTTVTLDTSVEHQVTLSISG